MSNTLFSLIVKKVLYLELSNNTHHSAQSDETHHARVSQLSSTLSSLPVPERLSNYAVESIKAMHNTKLSKTKRDLVDKLLQAIKQLPQDNDATFCAALKALINKYKTDIITERDKEGENPGNTEKLLGDLTEFLDLFYHKIKELTLVDYPPFN